jgi:hypothetical protein
VADCKGDDAQCSNRCRAAAQTCVAMLGAPGGLFLDVKSAYSSAGDLQLFVAALAGIGVNVKVPLSGFGARV